MQLVQEVIEKELKSQRSFRLTAAQIAEDLSDLEDAEAPQTTNNIQNTLNSHSDASTKIQSPTTEEAQKVCSEAEGNALPTNLAGLKKEGGFD